MGKESTIAITNYVFVTTAVADEIIEGLDEKLSETAFDEYAMSREVLTVVRETMASMSMLTKKLFEENLAIMDAITSALEKKETP